MSLALGIHNTRLVLILADTAFALPISLWILKSYLDSIPVDLEEAAMVDGCTRLHALLRVVLPLALPGLIGTGTFAFLWAWNEFMFAVVLTSGPDAAPLTIAISLFFTQYGRDWSSIMALNVIATLPLMLLFVFLQRWVVQGMTAGAVK
jgi:ABC-type glycerol-3-phosphate transport system permease component